MQNPVPIIYIGIVQSPKIQIWAKLPRNFSVNGPFVRNGVPVSRREKMDTNRSLDSPVNHAKTPQLTWCWPLAWWTTSALQIFPGVSYPKVHGAGVKCRVILKCHRTMDWRPCAAMRMQIIWHFIHDRNPKVGPCHLWWLEIRIPFRS